MGYNIYFGGSVDYLIANANSGSFGTSDFTVEAFVKSVDSSTNRFVVSNYNTYNSNSFALIAGHGSATNKYSVALGSTGFPNIAGSSRPNTKNFDHVAVTRQGNTITLYVNGNREGSAVTFTGNLTHSSGNTWIGTDPVPTQTYFKGWIKGVRIIKNECLYTANFTPPTILTLTTNTTLLTCNALALTDNLCIDQSNIGYSITTVGEVGLAGDGIDTQNTIISVPINYSVGNVFNQQYVTSNSLISVPINYNQDYTGDGKIFGTVKKRINKVNVPLADTKVYLYTVKEKNTLKQTTSNTTGHFLFENLNINEKYYVSAFDPDTQEVAVIADNITPDPM